MGRLNYSLLGDEILIQMVEVKEAHRRKGVATGLLEQLEREHPEADIELGYSTDEGTAWLKAIGRFGKLTKRDQRKADAVAELVNVRAEENRLDAEMSAELAKPGHDQERVNAIGDQMNAVADRIRDLEETAALG